LVLGTSPENNAFRFKGSPGISYPPLFVFGNPADQVHPMNIEGSVSSGESFIGEVTFIIPRQISEDDPALPPGHQPNNPEAMAALTNDPEIGGCFISQTFDHGGSGHVADLDTPCEDADGNFFTSNRVRISLYIEGSSTGTSSDGQGKVELLIGEVGSANGSLGGRILSGNGPHSLVPRGVPTDYIQNEGYRGDFQEFDDHGAGNPLLRLEYDKAYRIRFRLKHDSGGQVHWKANKIRIFAHQFELGEPVADIPCNDPMLPSQQEENTACSSAQGGPAGVHDVVVHTDQAPLQVESDIFVGYSAQSEQYSQSQFCDELNLAHGVDLETCEDDYREMATSPVVENIARSHSCPEIGSGSPANVGVSQEPASDGFIYDSPQAASICPANGEGFPVTNIRWNEVEQEIPGEHSAQWSRQDCNQTEIPAAALPAEVQAYPKHFADQILFSHFDSSPIHTGPESGPENDPDYLVTSNPTYNCQDYPVGFQAASVEYNREIPDLPSGSLFSGLQYELGCDWEDQVRSAAQAIGMNQNAWFEPQRADQTTVELPGQPQNECVTFWTDPGAPGDLITLGQFAASDIPEICHQPGEQCHLQFLGFDGESSSTLEINPELAAEYFGFNEVRATYPRAKWGCEEEDCVNIELEQVDGQMRAEGTVYAPLNLLLGKTLELGFSEQRAWEGSLIR